MMKPDRLQLVFAHIDEAVPAPFLNYAKPAHASENTLNVRQIQKWKSRRLAHFLLHQLCKKNGINHRLLANIRKTKSGRPYLCHNEVDFNISHSGEWVALIFSRSTIKKAVGIDIEHPQKDRPYEKLLQYYADLDEIRDIQQFSYLPQLTSITPRFYLSWCLREAVLKAQGVGIVKLSAVNHSLQKQHIRCDYCPQGKLFFYHTLPFYLACFIQQDTSQYQAPEIFQWKSQQLQRIDNLDSITYQVN